MKSWLIGKDPDAGKDWGQEEKGVTEDEMVGWHHLLNGHEFNQTLGDSEGQEAWLAAVHGVAKSQTQLSNCAITITTIMTFKCFPINIPLSLFTLSDQFPPVQINWANIKEPGTESMIYARGRAGWPQHQGTYFFFFNDLTGGKWKFPNQGLNPCHLEWEHRVLMTKPSGSSKHRYFWSSVFSLERFAVKRRNGGTLCTYWGEVKQV